MKGVPIKFRGVDADGKCHYGDLVHGRTAGQTYIQIIEHYDLFDEGDGFCVRIAVIPESVRQLVGYDINGEEIYENDLICELVSFSHFEKYVCCLWQGAASLTGIGVSVANGTKWCSLCEPGGFYSKFYRIAEDDTIKDCHGKKIGFTKQILKDAQNNEYEKIVLNKTVTEFLEEGNKLSRPKECKDNEEDGEIEK